MQKSSLSRFVLQVVATLAYTDQFQYPLTVEEIWRRLVDEKQIKSIFLKKAFKDKFSSEFSKSKYDQNHSLANVKKIVALLVKKKLILKKGVFYALVGSKKHFTTRVRRKKFSQKKKAQIKVFVKFAKKIPWIKAVAVTGAQAMDNISHAEDDVDFLVVTSRNKLWLVRPMVIFFSLFMKRKALFWQKNKNDQARKDDWCFNLWLDEDRLSLPLWRRNIYTAYEISQVKWVFDRADIQLKFAFKNKWVLGILPHIISSKKSKNIEEKEVSSSIFNYFLAFLNKILYFLQFGYLMKKLHISASNASEGEAYLHLGNMKKVVYNRWRQTLRRLNN